MNQTFLMDDNTNSLEISDNMIPIQSSANLPSLPNNLSANNIHDQNPQFSFNNSNLHSLLPVQSFVNIQQSATPFNQSTGSLINFNPVFNQQANPTLNASSNSGLVSNQIVTSITNTNTNTNTNLPLVNPIPYFNNIPTPNISIKTLSNNAISNIATPINNAFSNPRNNLHSTSVTSSGTNNSVSNTNPNSLAAMTALKNNTNYLFNSNYLYGSSIPVDVAVVPVPITKPGTCPTTPSNQHFDTSTKLPKLIIPNENPFRSQSNLREKISNNNDPLVEFDGNSSASVSNRSDTNNNIMNSSNRTAEIINYQEIKSNSSSGSNSQTDNRRHSLTLAILRDNNKETVGPLDCSNSLLQQSESTSLKDGDTCNTNITRHRRKYSSKIKNSINTSDSGSNGESYNKMGQLIGKSGKVLRNTKRAAQNRSAQKAFRIRREIYIKDLEDKALHFDAIIEENKRLANLVKELQDSLSERESSNSSTSTLSSISSVTNKTNISTITKTLSVPFKSLPVTEPTSHTILVKKEATD